MIAAMAGCTVEPATIARVQQCQRGEATYAWTLDDYENCNRSGVACLSIYSTSTLPPATEPCQLTGPEQNAIIATLDECCRFPNGYSLLAWPGDCVTTNGLCAMTLGLFVQRIETCVLDADRDCDRDYDLVDFAALQRECGER
jgi:hypothetical protein